MGAERKTLHFSGDKILLDNPRAKLAVTAKTGEWMRHEDVRRQERPFLSIPPFPPSSFEASVRTQYVGRSALSLFSA